MNYFIILGMTPYWESVPKMNINKKANKILKFFF